MRKLAAAIALALLLCWSAGAATITVTSTSDAGGGVCPGANCTLRQAVAIAVPNDTIAFSLPGPTPTITLGSTLTIQQGMFLSGPGRDVLTITGNSNPVLSIAPNATAISQEQIIRVEGITFNGNNSSTQIIAVTGAGAIAANNPKPYRYLVIGNCRIKNMGNPSASSGGVYATGHFSGVIFNTIFDRCGDWIDFNGSDDFHEWTNPAYVPFAYGSSDNVYIEDCQLTFSATGSWAEPGHTYVSQGARAVFRYNTFAYANAQDAGEIHDNHGFQNWPGNGQTGLMLTEYYGNTYTNFNGFRWHNHRGSWMLCFDNVLTGTNPGLEINQYASGDAGGSGCAAQVASGTGLTPPLSFIPEVNNTYVWNNTTNGTVANMEPGGTIGNGCGTAENSSYYNFNASFNGTTGIGRGTAPPSGAATNGVAYWQAPVPGVTTNKTDVQAGHLWKRINGVWVDYYTPFPYPHFLRSTGPSPTPTATATGTPSPTATATATATPSSNVYYIAPSGSGGSDLNPGTIGSPWLTFTHANSVLIPGDTVYVRAGTYTTFIAPTNTGTSGGTITYSQYNSEVVTIQNAAFGIHLDGKSYITVHGILFTNLDAMMYLENASSHNTISNCSFIGQRGTANWAGTLIWQLSNYNHITDCIFSTWGRCSGGVSIGSVFEIGYDDGDLTTPGNYNLIENCTLFHGGHHTVGIHGNHNIFRNNYTYNDAWTAGKGERMLYMNGFSAFCNRNLIENNRIGYSDVPCDSWGQAGATISTEYNIFRKNYFFYNNLEAITFQTTDSYHPNGPNRNYVYNNTFHHNGWQLDPNGQDDPLRAQIGFNNYSTAFTVVQNVIKNNIFYQAPRLYGFQSQTAADEVFANNYNGDLSGSPSFVNASATPGTASDPTLPNLTLNSNSPAINYGAGLTTITSTSGSGTSFVVSDANYFTDGWGIVTGDYIQVAGRTGRAHITSVNYSTGAITTDAALIWTQNQGLSLIYDGASPDAGAYEFPSATATPTATATATATATPTATPAATPSVTPFVNNTWLLNKRMKKYGP